MYTEMLVAQISDGQVQLGGLFNGLKVQVDKYEEVINKFKDLDLSKAKFLNTDGSKNWDKIAESIEGCDERVLSYFKTLDDGNGTINNASASIDGLSEHLKKTGQSFDIASLKATALNVALNVGIILAVTVAVKALSAAWDYFNVTVEEQQEKISNLSSEIETLQQEYDELSSKQAITDAERERLDYLEKRLDLDKQILEAETIDLYKEQRGNKWNPTDWFDQDNDVVKSAKEFGSMNDGGKSLLSKLFTGGLSPFGNIYDFSALFNGYEKTIKSAEKPLEKLKDLREEYAELQKEQQQYAKGSFEYELYQNDMDANIEMQSGYLKKLENSYTDLLQKQGEYLQEAEKYKEQIDSGLLSGDDLTDAQEKYDKWNDAYNNINNLTISVGQVIGKFDEFGNKVEEVQESISNTETDISLTDITSQISAFTTAHEALNTAISEQNKNGTISNETLKTLYDNYENIDSAIELTTNGIRLNTAELAKLNVEKKNAIKTELAEKEKQLTDAYNKGSVELAVYQETLAHCTDAKSDDYQALSNLIEQKQADQEATLGQIGELENLSLQYENVISKHNAFVNALSSEDAGSGYDAVTSGLKQVEEAWSNGDYGKDEIRALVDYMSYNDMSTASIADIKNAYEDAITTAHKYFTETTEGQENFLHLLEETKVNNEALASVDSTGNWSINITDMAEAAKACGFSVDFLSDNLKKLEEKGFEGTFIDTNDLVDTSAQIKEIDNQIAQLQTRLHYGDQTEGLQEELEKLKNTRAEISVELDQSKVKKSIDDILSLQTQIENLTNSGGSSSAIIEMQNKQKSIASQNGIDLNSVLNVDTNDAQSKWDVFKETIENSDLKTDVTVSANTNPFDTAVRTITNGTYTAKIGLQVTASGVVSKVKEVIKNAVSGEAGAYGSANITGHSYADGNIGIRKEQKNVMVSEIKPEMVVDPHSGEYTIYKTPTMLAKLPKDAIVFNGKQTEEILKNGMTTSFGKAYSKGYNSSGTLSGGSGSSNSKKSSKKKSKESSKTLIDWIERRINVLTQKAERWANIIENATNPKRLDSYYKKLEENYKKQLKTYSDGATRYLQKANSIKLDSGLKNKVKSKDSSIFNKDGSMKSYKKLIKEYGEKTAKKIQDYQNWYLICHIA